MKRLYIDNEGYLQIQDTIDHTLILRDKYWDLEEGQDSRSFRNLVNTVNRRRKNLKEKVKGLKKENKVYAGMIETRNKIIKDNGIEGNDLVGIDGYVG